MIEGLQVIVHLPLFDLKSPGNINSFNVVFVELANFNILDTEDLTNEISYYPEEDAFSLNFENAGYDGNILVPLLGTLFYLAFGILALYVVDFLLKQLAKKFPKIEKVRRRLNDFLYWNGSIRFFTEAYTELTLCALLNLKNLDWSGDFNAVTSSNILTIAVSVLVVGLPIFFVILIAKKLKSSNSVKFPQNLESLVEGSNLKM